MCSIWLSAGRREPLPKRAPTDTIDRAAFTSLSRLQYACAMQAEFEDFNIASKKGLSMLAGRFASRRTLVWARKAGLPWNESICEGAALAGRLKILEWLRHTSRVQCPWKAQAVFTAALQRRDLPMLMWVQAAVERTTKYTTPLGVVKDLKGAVDQCDDDWDPNIPGANDWIHDLDILTWLYKVYWCLQKSQGDIFNLAIQHRAFHSLLWMETRFDLDPSASLKWRLRVALTSGSLPIFLKIVGQDEEAAAQLLEQILPDYLGYMVDGPDVVAILQYISEHHPASFQSHMSKAFIACGRAGNVAAVVWLIPQGAEWSMLDAKELASEESTDSDTVEARCWPLETFSYAISHDCSWPEWPVGLCHALRLACYDDVVDWVHQQHNAPCGSNCPARVSTREL